MTEQRRNVDPSAAAARWISLHDRLAGIVGDRLLHVDVLRHRKVVHPGQPHRRLELVVMLVVADNLLDRRHRQHPRGPDLLVRALPDRRQNPLAVK